MIHFLINAIKTHTHTHAHYTHTLIFVIFLYLKVSLHHSTIIITEKSHLKKITSSKSCITMIYKVYYLRNVILSLLSQLSLVSIIEEITQFRLRFLETKLLCNVIWHARNEVCYISFLSARVKIIMKTFFKYLNGLF